MRYVFGIALMGLLASQLIRPDPFAFALAILAFVFMAVACRDFLIPGEEGDSDHTEPNAQSEASPHSDRR